MIGTRIGRGAGSGSRRLSLTMHRPFRSWAQRSGAERPQLFGDFCRWLLDLVADEGMQVRQHEMEQGAGVAPSVAGSYRAARLRRCHRVLEDADEGLEHPPELV